MSSVKKRGLKKLIDVLVYSSGKKGITKADGSLEGAAGVVYTCSSGSLSSI